MTKRNAFPHSRSFTKRMFVMLPTVAAFVFLMPAVTTAQAMGEIPSLPEEAARLRREQLRLAMEAGVELSYSDIGQRSGSHLLQVPPEFRELQILDEADLEAILDELYPYYAFSGTESLVFEHKQTRGQKRTSSFANTSIR